jgi:membrane associated rhomboid family serine protease
MSRYHLDYGRSSWQNSGCPLVIGLIVAKFIVMLLYIFKVPLADFLTFDAPIDWNQPWRALTYPFTSFYFGEVLFSGLTLFFFGGSLERAWGTRTFAIILAVISIITALGITLGAFLLKVPAFPVQSWVVVAALVVAWGAINPFESVLLWFIPVQGRWLAVIDALFVFFNHVQFSPIMGVCALAGCGAAHLWLQNRSWGNVTHWTIRRPIAAPRKVKPQRHHDDAFSWRDLNPFERIARARRKKQFERLFEDDK